MVDLASVSTVLGVWDGHDAGVALLQDGVLQFALSEERLARKKRASGFPYRALDACLGYCGLRPEDVDLVAMPGRYGRLLHRAGDQIYRSTNTDRDPLSFSSTMVRRLEIGVARTPGVRELEALGSRSIMVSRLRRLGVSAPIEWIDHHDAHAHCAALGGLADAMVVTMDGYGDGLAATFDGPGHTRECLASPANSVALVYGAVTRMLGFGEGDEGKIMGLAAHGDPNKHRDWFNKVIGFGGCDPRLGGRVRRSELQAFEPADVAAAMQQRVEEVVLGWIEARRRGRNRLALAGGLFANVSLNGRLAEKFAELYVFPHMGDGGLCVGAAVANRSVQSFGLPFLGPVYEDAAMRSALKRAGLEVQRFDHPEQELVRAICNGQIAARFVGRSEFGPRALGHRSILLRADQPELTDRLNLQLGRDDFMPFAPIRRHGAGSPTMTVVVSADNELKSQCPAAVHVDGTVRTQIVSEDEDPGLWLLLELAEEQGFPALINTSFNRHGEPIVETPEHAVATFLAANLDIMQMGPYIVRRDS